LEPTSISSDLVARGQILPRNEVYGQVVMKVFFQPMEILGNMKEKLVG